MVVCLSYYGKKVELEEAVMVESYGEMYTEYSIMVSFRFNMDWRGFKDVMAFENQFRAKRLGKKEWNESGGERSRLSGVYGWIARDDDYNSDGMVARILRKNGELKTVEDVAEEEAREGGMMVAALAKKMEVRNKYWQELDCRYGETKMLLKIVTDSKAKMLQDYNECQLVVIMIAIQSVFRAHLSLHLNQVTDFSNLD